MRRCANCDEKPARWRPDYSPLVPVFCTQRCAAAYAHELVASETEAEDERVALDADEIGEAEMDDFVSAVRAQNGCTE